MQGTKQSRLSTPVPHPSHRATVCHCRFLVTKSHDRQLGPQPPNAEEAP